MYKNFIIVILMTMLIVSFGPQKKSTINNEIIVNSYSILSYDIYDAEIISLLNQNGSVRTFRMIGDGFDIDSIDAYNYNHYTNNYRVIEYIRYGEVYQTLVVPLDI